MFENPEITKYIHKRKFLAVYHNINQRFLEDWKFYSDKPPTLLEKIEIDVDRQTATRYIYNCIKKLYGLMLRLRPVMYLDFKSFINIILFYVQSEEDKNYDPQESIKSASVSFQSPARLRLSDYLPEYSLLDFLLKTEHTECLEKYLLNHGFVPDADYYEGKNMV